MAFNNPTVDRTAITDIASWETQYKEQWIEMEHDNAMFDMVSPDDSIMVAGPARLSSAGSAVGATASANDGLFYVIGVCQNIQISETAQIQPLKSIGSRRHLFTKTNTPASASIGRMMFYGKNLARALYALIDDSPISSNNNNKYAQGAEFEDSKFLTNLEEDLYRIPFGLGIIYHTPRTAANATVTVGDAVGAEYLECCYLQSRNVSIQSGQTVVMEQVQLLADRVVPWDAYSQLT